MDFSTQLHRRRKPGRVLVCLYTNRVECNQTRLGLLIMAARGNTYAPTRSGRVQSSLVHSITVQYSPVHLSPVQSMRVQYNTVQSSPCEYNPVQSIRAQSSPVHSSPVQFIRIQSSSFEYSPTSLDETRRFIYHFWLGSVNRAWQLLLCVGKWIWKSLFAYLGTTRQCTMPLIATIKRQITKPVPDMWLIIPHFSPSCLLGAAQVSSLPMQPCVQNKHVNIFHRSKILSLCTV